MRKSIYPAVNQFVEKFLREHPEADADNFLAVLDATISVVDKNGIDKGLDICQTILSLARD